VGHVVTANWLLQDAISVFNTLAIKQVHDDNVKMTG
jgi:hypothetical protein